MEFGYVCNNYIDFGFGIDIGSVCNYGMYAYVTWKLVVEL